MPARNESLGEEPLRPERVPSYRLPPVARDLLLHSHEPDVLARQLANVVVEDSVDRPTPPAQHEPDRGSPRMLPQVGRQELQVLEVMSVEAVDDVLLGKISIWTCLPWRSTWIREFWTGFTPSDFDAKVRDGTFTVV